MKACFHRHSSSSSLSNFASCFPALLCLLDSPPCYSCNRLWTSLDHLIIITLTIFFPPPPCHAMCDDCSGDAIPLAVPLVIATLASFMRAVTGFGDGITFQTCWYLASSMGLLPCLCLKKAVLYSTIMQSLTMPLQIWQARQALPNMLGYAAVMASFGAPGVYFGAEILLVGDVSGVKVIAGSVFLAFAALKLLGEGIKSLSTAKKAAQKALLVGQGAEEAALKTAGGREAAVIKPVLATVTDAAAPSSSAFSPQGSAAVSHSLPKEEGEGEGEGERAAPPPPTATELSLAVPARKTSPCSSSSVMPAPSAAAPVAEPRSLLQRLFPPISPVLAPRGMALLLSCTSIVSGLLAGMFGAGGPPTIAATTFLQLDKETLRGFAIVPSVYMVIRLCMYTSSRGAVFDPQGEWHVYLGIWLVSLLSSHLGNKLRSRLPVQTIVLLLLWVVLLSSALLLGALKQPAVGAAYLLGVGAALTLWGLGRWRPLLVPDGLLSRKGAAEALRRCRGGPAASSSARNAQAAETA